jgi:hypothetical protein
MIDIPIGKALIAVESDGTCSECVIKKLTKGCPSIACYKRDRQDGIQACFKIVDYPSRGNK